MEGYLYILASKRNDTLYIGATSDLIRRVWEHKNKVIDGFTKKYDVVKLVYFERYDGMSEALLREKRIKLWKREWKLNLIEKENPKWDDLYDNLI